MATKTIKKTATKKRSSVNKRSGQGTARPRNNYLKFAVPLLVIGLVAFALVSKNNSKATIVQQNKTVTIGLLAPMEGSNVTTGNDRKRAINLARKDLNLQNVTIKLVLRDSSCEAETATKGFIDMVKKDHVIAVIGDDCSSSTLAVAREANKRHVVLISPASTSPAVTQAGPYVFRTVPSDEQQGVFAAKLLLADGKRTLAILHEDGAYGEGLAAALVKNYVALGGTVLDNQVFVTNSLDQTSQLQHIKVSGASALYVISGDPNSDTAILLKINELKLHLALYGSEALKIPSFLNDAGTSAEGLILSSLSDGTVNFKEKYLAEYGVPANDYVAPTYDAYVAIAKAVESGATTGEMVQTKFRSLEFDGASGHIKFDTNGDVAAGYEAVIVKNQAFVHYEAFN